MANSLHHFLMALPTKLREEDKVKHMVWSFWLMLAALILWPAQQAIAVVFLIGLAKEFWDARFGSGFCMFDMAGNVLGMIACLLCWFAFFTWY